MTVGSLLFGEIDGRGQVTYCQVGVPVTKDLLLRLPVAEEAEQKFRFASPCARSACIHWAGKCSLSSKLAEFQAFKQGEFFEEIALPTCAIRTSCRWFLQDGPGMCSKCEILSRVAWSGKE